LPIAACVDLLMKKRLKSACAAAPDQIHNGQQDGRTDERDEQCGHAEVVLIDGPNSDERRDKPTCQHGTNDANDHIQNDALLSIGLHQHACQPTDQTAYNEPNDEVHDEFSFRNESEEIDRQLRVAPWESVWTGRWRRHSKVLIHKSGEAH
jgi:hypothetical protein